MTKFQLFTDSSSDLPKDLRKQYNIEFLRMGLVVDGVEKSADLDWEEYTQEEFYGWLSAGKSVKTTQISINEFVNRFTPYLENGVDVLYLACSSALTSSLSAMELAKEELCKKYPERKILGVDTLTSACTLGILVLDAAKYQQEGHSIEETIDWVEKHKFNYNQFATVDTLTYLKNAGRIKGAKALMGNLFHKKPIFISDRKGNNYTIKTVTGEKNADNELINGIKETINKEECNRVVIGQGMAMDRALRLQKRLKDELNLESEIWWIGPIVGTTCGPGIVSTFCYGKEVTIYDKEN